MNLGDIQTTNGVAAVLKNDDDVDTHLERIKNEYLNFHGFFSIIANIIWWYKGDSECKEKKKQCSNFVQMQLLD